MDLELGGKKVVVSAATRGVGRVIAEGFLSEGAVVSLCGRRARRGEPNPSNKQVFANPMEGDGVEETVEVLSRLGTVHGSVVDCGYFEQVTAWVEQAASDMGGIDILVSCASALGGFTRNVKY